MASANQDQGEDLWASRPKKTSWKREHRLNDREPTQKGCSSWLLVATIAISFCKTEDLHETAISDGWSQPMTMHILAIRIQFPQTALQTGQETDRLEPNPLVRFTIELMKVNIYMQ